MIRKRGNWFYLGTNAKRLPEIMPKQKDEIMIRFKLVGS
jgi:hypothetical protein